MTETTQRDEPATPEFVWKLAQEYSLHFPQAADPGKALHKYANSTTISLPFQVAVDLRSAKIVFADGGTATKADIEKIAAKTLDGF